METLPEKKIIMTRKTIGHSEIIFTNYGGRDTSVKIAESLILWIADYNIDQFMTEMESLILKYRI